jgi:Mn-dependent DtxR family transcriptional regulator
MIVKREIETFTLLPSSETKIAKKLGLSSGTISKIVAKMIENGLAIKKRQGMKVIVETAQTSHAQKLEVITKNFKRLPLENILSYANLKLIAIIEYPLNKKEISQLLHVSRQWTYKTIKNLSRYGIILKKQDGYYLNSAHQPLFYFAKEYYNYKNHQTVKTISEDAQIIWQHGSEFLFKTKNVLTDHAETAVTAFSTYNLPLLGDIKYYYHTTRQLQVTDIILHTILINPQSKTYNAYACLLYEKTKPKDIIKKARMYNLTEHIQTLILFIEKQESEKKFLPTWDEYKSLARQYGVN